MEFPLIHNKCRDPEEVADAGKQIIQMVGCLLPEIYQL
jgi:hypothetical protein